MDTSKIQNFDHKFKYIRMSQDMLDTAMKKGFEQGIEQGRIEERIKNKTEVIIKGFDSGIGIAMLANLTTLTEEEVLQILRENGKL